MYKIPPQERNVPASEAEEVPEITHADLTTYSLGQLATVTASSEGCGPRRWGRQGAVCSIHSLIQPVGAVPPMTSQNSAQNAGFLVEHKGNPP